MEDVFVIGVDVGTGSARAALVSATGRVCTVAVRATRTWTPKPDYFQQSTQDIWNAVCEAVQVGPTAARSVPVPGLDSSDSLTRWEFHLVVEGGLLILPPYIDQRPSVT